MKTYHKIYHYHTIEYGKYCYAFDKLDGSNIRVYWNRKLSKKSTSTYGFSKFGTRNNMINNINSNFGDSITIFMNKYSTDLDKIFNDEKIFRGIESIMVYCEYFGENSFAGQHNITDKKDLVLFDVELYKKGFLNPKDFITTFENIHTPNVVYSGEFNSDLIQDVRNNRFNLKEGVVCKGSENGKIWMCKIKTDEWIHKVKTKLGENFLKEELDNNIHLYD